MIAIIFLTGGLLVTIGVECQRNWNWHARLSLVLNGYATASVEDRDLKNLPPEHPRHHLGYARVVFHDGRYVGAITREGDFESVSNHGQDFPERRIDQWLFVLPYLLPFVGIIIGATLIFGAAVAFIFPAVPFKREHLKTVIPPRRRQTC
jgi:hypothetical protein